MVKMPNTLVQIGQYLSRMPTKKLSTGKTVLALLWVRPDLTKRVDNRKV